MKYAVKCLILLSFVCFVVLVTRTILAQQGEWREVSREEPQMKTSRVEPDADAEAIFWEVHVDDSSEYELVRKHYVRVKIFTERG
jgi:hypothetical protein